MTLERSVQVRDQADLLEPRCVEQVDGWLSISRTDFYDLAGLESLQTVGGLSIIDNDNLVSLRGLDNLTSVRWGLHIARNASLVEVAGLEALTTVDESLLIEENRSLVDLAGLSSLASLADSPEIISGGTLLRISNNANLESLRGLERLKDVAGTFDICGNPLLSELLAASDLHADRLVVLYNAALDDAAAQAFGATVSPAPKVTANGAAFGVFPRQVCPWRGDGTCDEPDAFHGDALQSCTEPPCCTSGGPTALCETGSDEPRDCPGPIGPL